MSLCRFFDKPGGCRFGSSCKFKHGAAGESAPGQLNASTSGTNHHAISREDIPKGVCHFFWRSGSCNKGFACKFNHRRPTPTQDGSHPVDASLSPRRLTMPGPPLPTIGNNGASLSPEETQARIKRFLQDAYRFSGNARDARTFLWLISNSSDDNKKWVRISFSLL